MRTVQRTRIRMLCCMVLRAAWLVSARAFVQYLERRRGIGAIVEAMVCPFSCESLNEASGSECLKVADVVDNTCAKFAVARPTPLAAPYGQCSGTEAKVHGGFTGIEFLLWHNNSPWLHEIDAHEAVATKVNLFL